MKLLAPIARASRHEVVAVAFMILASRPASAGEIVIRFEPGVFTVSDSSASRFTWDDVSVSDENARHALVDLEVNEFQAMCVPWRYMDPLAPQTDINGDKLIARLSDFGDVFVLSYAADVPCRSAASVLEQLESVVYAQGVCPRGFEDRVNANPQLWNVREHTIDAARKRSAFEIKDSLFVATGTPSFEGQWCFDNTGVLSGSTEDVDINLPEALAMTRKIVILD